MRRNGWSSTSDRWEALIEGDAQRKLEHEEAMKRVPICSCGFATGGRSFTDAQGQMWTVIDMSCPIHQPPPIIPAISNTSRIDYHRKARPERP